MPVFNFFREDNEAEFIAAIGTNEDWIFWQQERFCIPDNIIYYAVVFF